ncbi:MAG: hypothetical protein ACR2NR_12365 [Solirubrobacteraceae bacterium]
MAPAVALLAAALAVLAAAMVSSSAAHAAAHATRPTKPRPRPPQTITPITPSPVPQGFVGMDVAPPVYGQDNSPNFDNQIGSMVTNGVQSIRIAFNWSTAEPYQLWSDVPPADASEFTNVAGKPFDFQQTDMFVGAAAQRGVTVLPTVLYTPQWDAQDNKHGVDTPKLNAPYGAYLSALIGRYGPQGSFWRENPQIPELPIRSWQIWNEENLSYYWPQPFASSYAGLLRTAHAAIRRADPGAKVVLGALTNLAWKSIGQLYRVGGTRNLFDVASINGFTKLPADVILYMRYMRNAMNHFNDRAKPLLATEISWPSAIGKAHQQFDFDTTEAGQARDIAALLPLIGQSYKSLGLAGFYYDTWMGDENDQSLAFNYAGLLRFRKGVVSTKPALAAYRNGVLALEQCRSKGPLATSCAH